MAGMLLRTQEVLCRVWSTLKERRSIKLQAAVQEAKQTARSEQARFERALRWFIVTCSSLLSITSGPLPLVSCQCTV
jgi:hypothetical protein